MSSKQLKEEPTKEEPTMPDWQAQDDRELPIIAIVDLKKSETAIDEMNRLAKLGYRESVAVAGYEDDAFFYYPYLIMHLEPKPEPKPKPAQKQSPTLIELTELVVGELSGEAAITALYHLKRSAQDEVFG